ARSVTSSATVWQRSPSSLRKASSRSCRRPVAITRLPASAKRRATAAPKPEVAPVMKTVSVLASIMEIMQTSFGGQAAVDGELGAGDESGFVGEEIDAKVGDFGRLAHAAQRDVAGHARTRAVR